MTRWNDTVKEVFKKNRAINPSYMFKDALKDAKKVYRSSEKMVSKTMKTGKKMVSKTMRSMKKKGRGKTQKKHYTGKKHHDKKHHGKKHRKTHRK